MNRPAGGDRAYDVYSVLKERIVCLARAVDDDLAKDQELDNREALKGAIRDGMAKG